MRLLMVSLFCICFTSLLFAETKWGSVTSYEDTAEAVVGTPQANEVDVKYKVQTFNAATGIFANFSSIVEITVEGDPQTKQGAGPKDEIKIAASVNLEQNYPNPFNPQTQITFQLPKAAFV